MNNKLKEYKLCDLYKMDSGISTSKSQAGKGSDFLSFGDIYNNIIVPDELSEKMNTTKEEQEKYSIKKGDVFITRTSEVIDELAMSCVALKDYPNATFSGFAKRLRPIQNTITYDKYMAFFFRSSYFRKIINAKAFMTLRASFNEEIFKDIKFMLIDYNNQKKIGNFLYKLELKKKNNNKIIKELDNYMKTLYQRWFLEYHYPDINGNSYKKIGGKFVYNETIKREIPEDWKVYKIKDVIKQINTGLNPRDNFKLGNGNIKYVTVKNLTTSGTIDFEGCDLLDEEAREKVHNRSDLSKNDILFASIAPLGRCVVVQEDPIDWDINESVFSIRPDFEKITSEFLYMFFMSDYFIKKAEHSSAGSIFKGIRINTIEEMQIVIPEDRVLRLFSDKIRKVLYKKYVCERENEGLKELKEFLLPLLINGQINVEND